MVTNNKLGWYDEVAKMIIDNLEDFYNTFYDQQLINVGNSYTLRPCPRCGHNDCCTIGEAVHCFSCKMAGTHINVFLDYQMNNKGLTKRQAIKKLEDWSNIPYPKGKTKEECQEREALERLNDIKLIACDYYKDALLNCDNIYSVKNDDDKTVNLTPIQYQKIIRGHKIDSLIAFRVGFVHDYKTLKNKLLDMDYSEDEIKASKIWFPEGVFIYPSINPITKDIDRFNIKNPFKATMKGKNEEDIVIKGMSSGEKCIGFAPGFSFSKKIVVVEGENDAISVYENGYTNVCWLGGQIRDKDQQKKDTNDYKQNIFSNITETNQLFILKRCQKSIYICTDNDSVGREYVEHINNSFPEKVVKKVNFSEDFNDIDDFYVKGKNQIDFKDLMAKAEDLSTDKFIVYRDKNIWTIENRKQKIAFEITGKDSSNRIIGKTDYFVNGNLVDREEDKSLTKCKANKKPLNFYLDDYIQSYFNADLDIKSFDELIRIYPYCSNKSRVIQILAKKIYDVLKDNQTKQYDDWIQELKIRMQDDVVDCILKEINDLQNLSVMTDYHNIPKMKLSQYFNIDNKEAYFYYTTVKQDGDTIRKLPYLLKNDGKQIRLDLLKRKDTQCLLLVDNKYELPFEVGEATLELRECSLSQAWVDKYINGEIGDNDINAYKLAKNIEMYIRKFFYHPNDVIFKILTLWIYGTYFYDLFSEYPYLLLNGEKGSGKSRLDSILYMFCLNAKLAANISEAALYRTICFEGGVMIMDEVENLTSKMKNADTVMGPVLKSGYNNTSGLVYRMNTEKNTVEGFTVYCPKVISNIQGVDDVLEDRCIRIETKRMKVEEIKLEDPKLYMTERLSIIRETTSKCCLSALRDFLTVFEIYNKSRLITDNARLTQLLGPLFSMALYIDLSKNKNITIDDVKNMTESELQNYYGEYTNALRYFNEAILAKIKIEVENSTTEGIIKNAVKCVALELAGLAEKDFTNPENHKFKGPILHDLKEGWFEINFIHLKCFIEETLPNEPIYQRTINKYIKTSFNKVDTQRRMVFIGDNEDLLRDFENVPKLRVYSYRFYFKDFIDDEYLQNATNRKLSLEDLDINKNKKNKKVGDLF